MIFLIARPKERYALSVSLSLAELYCRLKFWTWSGIPDQDSNYEARHIDSNKLTRLKRLKILNRYRLLHGIQSLESKKLPTAMGHWTSARGSSSEHELARRDLK